MDFSEALKLIKDGKHLTRLGWNGPGQFVQIQSPDFHSMMTLPYIFLTTQGEARVPWVASITDLLASDWEEVT